MTRIRFNALNCVDMGVGILLNISVPVKYKNAVQTILDGFKAGNEYDIEPHKEKRSLSANAIAWVYCDKLAEKLHSTKEEIYRIAVLPDYRRRGVAYRLLSYALKTERGRGLECVFLEVREGNLAARGLYRSYGFSEYGKRKNYYKNPTEDAVVMVLNHEKY